MRKLLLLTASVLFLGQTFATTPFELHRTKLKATEFFFPIGTTGKKISLMELSTISMDDLQALTQKRMNSFEKTAFKSAQKKFRKGISADGTIINKKLEKFFHSRSGESGFHAGGFALGFFLNIIGIIIAYLINDDYKRNRVKWAYIGTSVILGILTILVAVSSQ